VCVPLTWHDGALRVHVVAGSPDPESQGATKGLLVDSGSRDLALHAEDCAECGGRAHAAYVREDTTASPHTAHAAVGEERAARTIRGSQGPVVRHLADGREHLRRTCDVVRIWNGRRWTPLRALWEARGSSPRGASDGAAAASAGGSADTAADVDASVQGADDGEIGGPCVTARGAHGLRFSAVIKRQPTPGLEGASVSRGGTFGIGPGSWCTPPHTCVRLEIDARHGAGGRMWVGCDVPARDAHSPALAELRLVSDVTREAMPLASVERGVPMLGSDTYRVRVNSLAVCAKRQGRQRRRVLVPSGAQPTVAVVDTGSTCMFVSRPLWHELQRLAGEGDGDAVAEVHLDGVCRNVTLCVPYSGSSRSGSGGSSPAPRSEACLRPLPKSVRLPSTVCLLGALALRGCTLLLAPGATPTGRGARAWMSAPNTAQF